MKKLMDYAARITLGRLLISLAALSLTAAFIIVLLMSSLVRDSAVLELSHKDAQQTSRLIFQTLYSGMRKGLTKREIAETIHDLNKSFPELKINVYRGEIVARQFGAMADEQAAIEQDPALLHAMTSGHDTLILQENDTSRYLYPVLAKQECLECHTRSHLGAVHGVIEISYPVKYLKTSFGTVIDTVVAYTLAAMGAVFIILYFLMRHLVALPLSNLANVMRDMTRDMNFSHRVSGSAWYLELKQLTDYFNHLLATIRDYSARLEELSIRDPLTGLYNRRKFHEFLHNEIIRASRHERGFSVIMVDLDDFKYINDTFGHPTGDMALKEIAVMLAAELRSVDVLARLGGDEFAVILPETEVAMGLQVANKLHQALAGKEFQLPVGKKRITASFSMVSFPKDGRSEDQIYAAMDAVLYKAKAQGKNQVVTSESGGDRSMMIIFKQGDFLRNALREQRIEAFLQPIANVRTGEVMAYEVLGRIRDGELAVPAMEFVEVAEELGMAHELDREVFRKGLAHYAAIAKVHPGAKFFFNLFPSSFMDIEWVRGIPELVRTVGVPCESIVLEITEREALPKLSQVATVIEELRAASISVALDDFGSGFSSFMYLKYLAIDYVKIEGSFIRQIATDPRDRIMVEHISDMAHQFGLQTVAEFVEDEATAKILAEIGVDYAQGHYYGLPALPE
ncbi:MAG: EAL domain-containing protein [Pseudomonadota bacterium]